MPDAIDEVSGIFQMEMGGSPAPKPTSPSKVDVDAEPLFNDSPMEGEDSGPEESDRTERAPRKPAPKKERMDPEEDLGDEDGELEPLRPGENEEEEEEEEEEIDKEEPEDEEDEPRTGSVDPNARVTIKVDGEEQEVTVKEALEGYIRTKTFSQRMNKLTEEKTAVEHQRAQYAEVLVKEQKALEAITAELDALAPTEPDWEKLVAADPQEAFRQRVMWDRFKEAKSQLDTQKKENHEARLKQYNEGLQSHIAGETKKLHDTYPHWKDPEAKGRDLKILQETARKAGFTDQEIDSIYDSRMVKILMKAARYDRLSSKRLVPKSKSTNRPMPSGTGNRNGPQGGDRRRRDHSRIGSIDSAAGVFADILSKEQ